jgi:hypothetical protein
MAEIKAKSNDPKKLVGDVPRVSYDMSMPGAAPTKKRAYKIRRLAEPHLRKHVVKGKVYYTYCRGIDREIYLGDAEAILKAIQKTREGR